MAKRVSVRGAVRRAVAEQRRRVEEVRLLAGTVTRDTFQNFITRTGIGTNNQSDGNTYGFNPITNNRALLEWMYRGSWICGKAVDCVADDMTRAGVELGSDIKPDEADKINALIQQTQVWTKLNSALKWSRLYGGALAHIMIDGQDPATPLNVKTVGNGAFKGLQVLDRWQVNPSLENLVTEMGPELGLPKFYTVVEMAPSLPRQRIHHSRVFRLTGVEMPYWQQLNLMMWGCSVFEPLYDRLTAFDSTTQGTAQLVYRAHLRTLKVERLRDIIAAGNEALTGLVAQVEMMRSLQNNEGITLIDAKDEYEAHQYAFSGLSDVLLQFAQQLSGATGIPLVRLFGQSPAGLNSTGESDLRNYYDTVNQGQELKLRLPLNLTYQVAARSLGITLPDNFNYSFRPLWQLDAVQKADVAQKRTATVMEAQGAGLISDATALKELKQGAIETGVWSNITDEDIANADQEPPDPEEMMGAMPGADPDLPKAAGPAGKSAAKPSKPTGDGIHLVAAE